MFQSATGGLNARLRARLEAAIALHRQGQLARAKVIYADILRADPRQVEALHLLGIIAGQNRDFPLAIELLGKAVAIDPGNAAFHCNLGNAQRELRQARAAIASYDKALAISPQYAEAWSNRGNTLLGLRQFDAAIASHDRAIALKPDLAEAHSNRGYTLRELNRFEAAIASYDQAIAIRPDYAEAYANRGYVKQRMQQLDAAIADYDRAIAIDADDAEARWNKSLALLVGGNFEQGLPLFEWRWRRRHLRVREFTQPLWLGAESLQGKTILLHSEQGLGDTIQFCRYAGLVAGLGARVIMEVPRPLLVLLQGLEGVSQWVEQGTPLPAFDFHCPLLSLPLAFKTTIVSIPGSAAYLRSDAAKVEAWAARLGPKTARRVGIVWSGSAGHQNDLHRSLALSDVMARLPRHCQYFSLQKDLREPDSAALRQHPQLRHFGDALEDFADTAALCELMDVVISVDTSVAHLSAALGKRTWILLPSHPDWRWLLNRDYSPWYPSARLYRQGTAGDWSGVLEKVGADLQSLPD